MTSTTTPDRGTGLRGRGKRSELRESMTGGPNSSALAPNATNRKNIEYL